MGTTEDELKYSNGPTRICGGDELYAADVISSEGKKRLCVDANISSNASGIMSCWSKKIRYLDANVSNGGVARGTAISTSWVDVFSYSGSGFFGTCILNLETFADWRIRVLIDGEDILIDSNGISSNDIQADTVYDLDDLSDPNQSEIGISKGTHDRFIFHPALTMPIRYNSSVVIKVKRDSGSKKFQAGLITLSKET